MLTATPDTDIVVQTRAEALAQEEARIDRSFREIGEALGNIRDEMLWDNGEYESFEDYLAKRWERSTSWAHQRIRAAKTIAQLEYNCTPDTPLPASEGVTRELVALDDPATVWEATVQKFGQKPTAKQVKAVINGTPEADKPLKTPMDSNPTKGAPPEESTPEVDDIPHSPTLATEDALMLQVRSFGYGPVEKLMDDGVLTPKKALVLCTALAGCEVRVRSEMIRCGFRDTALIREMNRLAGRGSETYREIIEADGWIHNAESIPPHEATNVDLRRHLDWKRTQHLAEYIEKKNAKAGVIEEMPTTVYRGSPEKTAKMLKAILPADEIEALAKLLLEA